MKRLFYSIILLFCCSIALLFSLHAQETTAWNKKNNFPAGTRQKAAAFTINQNGYAGLGTDNMGFKKDFWQYDSKKDIWSQIEKFPAEARISAATFSINEKGYLGTGLVASQSVQQGTNDFWEFDPQKNSWSQKANFPGSARYGATGFSIRGKGYIALGTNKSSYFNDIWEYNPATNQWSRKADLPASGRADASAFVIGEEAYILLGQKKELIPSLKDCWKYIPEKNQWKQVADFPGQARVGALSFSYKNKGYVLCGFNGTLKRYQDFWQYDAPADKWLQKKDVPFGPRDFIFAFVIGTGAYVCTGHAQKSSSGFEIWEYDFNIEEIYASKIALGGSLLLGENRIPLAAVKVKLLNNKGETIKSVSTGLFGSFLFMDIPSNMEFTLAIELNDPHWKTQKIYLVNRENETIAILDPTNDFKFHIALQEKSKLQLLRIENKNMRMNMSGKLALKSGKDQKTPFAEANLSLIDNQQQIVQVATTDPNGKFVFDYLPVDTNLYLILDEQAIAFLPKGTTILLMDENDSIVDRTSSASSKFNLTNIPPEKNKLAKIYMEDPWMQASSSNFKEDLLVIERVYFDYAKWELAPQAKAVLNKVSIVLNNNKKVFLEISAHTDSRGNVESNLTLSEKRAQEAKKYIIYQGVNESRITAYGFGESRLLNRCKDGADCSEEEHAQNRRMEFMLKQVQQPLKKK